MDWRRSFAKAGSACRRCNRRTQTTSAPAPRLAECGASKATRRHGTWLLTLTQQITELSKHLLSKQPFKVTLVPGAMQRSSRCFAEPGSRFLRVESNRDPGSAA